MRVLSRCDMGLEFGKIYAAIALYQNVTDSLRYIDWPWPELELVSKLRAERSTMNSKSTDIVHYSCYLLFDDLRRLLNSRQPHFQKKHDCHW